MQSFRNPTGAGAKNEAVTNHGGDKTKDNGFHQVHLHGVSQVIFQPHREPHKRKRLFYGPTNSLGISHQEVTKMFNKTLTKKLAKDLTKEVVKNPTGKYATDLAKGEAETHTGKLARDHAKMFAKTKTKEPDRDLIARKLTKTLAEKLAKDHDKESVETLTGGGYSYPLVDPRPVEVLDT